MGHVPLRPTDLEQLISRFGPAVYISKLSPGLSIEHAVLITGTESTPSGPIVRFNDPGSGKEGRLQFWDLVADHPPLFSGTDDGVRTGMFAFFSREKPAELRLLPGGTPTAATAPGAIQRRSPLAPRTRFADVWTRYGPVTRIADTLGIGTATASLMATPVGAAASAAAAAAIQGLPRSRYTTPPPAGRSSRVGIQPRGTPVRPPYLTELLKRVPARKTYQAGVGMAPGTTYSDLTTRQGYRVDRFGFSVPTGRIGAIASATSAASQWSTLSGNPILAVARSLRDRPPPPPPMAPGTTFSDLSTRQGYRVDQFGFSVPTGHVSGSGRPADSLLARYDPIRTAANALR